MCSSLWGDKSAFIMRYQGAVLQSISRYVMLIWRGTSQVYEAKGGDYENQDGSKNEAKKGAPEPKDKAKKAASKKTGQVSTCY